MSAIILRSGRRVKQVLSWIRTANAFTGGTPSRTSDHSQWITGNRSASRRDPVQPNGQGFVQSFPSIDVSCNLCCSRILSSTEFLRTLLARANRSKEIVAVNSRGVTIVETELYRVVPNLCGGFCTRFWFVHGKNGRSGHAGKRNGDFLFAAFIVTCGAGAIVAKKRKVEMAFVAVGPGDVHTRTSLYVNFHRCRFSALVNR